MPHWAQEGLKGSKKLRWGGDAPVELIFETFSVYFPEVIFDDLLEPSFWGPRWRFGAHGDQKVFQKGAKRK